MILDDIENSLATSSESERCLCMCRIQSRSSQICHKVERHVLTPSIDILFVSNVMLTIQGTCGKSVKFRFQNYATYKKIHDQSKDTLSEKKNLIYNVWKIREI